MIAAKIQPLLPIPALREYLLLSQEEPKTERCLRNGDGAWTLTEATGLDSTLLLPALGIEIALREVYDKVDFFRVARLPNAGPVAGAMCRE